MSFSSTARWRLPLYSKRQRIDFTRDTASLANESARQSFTSASYRHVSAGSSLFRLNHGNLEASKPYDRLHLCLFEGRLHQSPVRLLRTSARGGSFQKLLAPSAQRLVSKAERAASTEVCSSRWQASTSGQKEPSLTTSNNMNRAAIAFGSNIGDRIAHIENALESMRANGLKILRLSRLYETAPMYYQNQDSFLNGAVLIETHLPPIPLLDLLQKIEVEQGRRREIEKGPRTLDLDIILYGEELIDVERLKVPHPGLLEREFVLRPLADIVPSHNLLPLGQKANGNMPIEVKSALTAITNPSEPILPITHVSAVHPPLTSMSPHRRTHLMSILNITPDSFSDGGQLSSGDLETLATTVRSHIASGATILDIGGQSTRPNATYLTASEELERVLPALRYVRQLPEAQNVAISLDTFHSDVAQQCAAEGLIDIINDISAGQMDAEMLRVMAESGRSVILMHMRGTPANMNKLTDYPEGVVRGVADELSQRVIEALESGIAPWRIILDPGIGFAKTIEQNLELLRVGSHGLVKDRPDVLHGYPWLVGTSRKGFIGRVTGVKEARERIWGTGACVTAAVAGGADIVRVHDVAEMKEVVAMADAIYRGHEKGKS